MTIHELQQEAHKQAKISGFYENGVNSRNNGELIALMHSELSEALEGIRHDNWSNVGEEMADTVIRIADFCEARKINLQVEVIKKMKKNKERPYKHGKKF